MIFGDSRLFGGSPIRVFLLDWRLQLKASYLCRCWRGLRFLSVRLRHQFEVVARFVHLHRRFHSASILKVPALLPRSIFGRARRVVPILTGALAEDRSRALSVLRCGRWRKGYVGMFWRKVWSGNTSRRWWRHVRDWIEGRNDADLRFNDLIDLGTGYGEIRKLLVWPDRWVFGLVQLEEEYA
jgi:hypothetical protein